MQKCRANDIYSTRAANNAFCDQAQQKVTNMSSNKHLSAMLNKEGSSAHGSVKCLTSQGVSTRGYRASNRGPCGAHGVPALGISSGLLEMLCVASTWLPEVAGVEHGMLVLLTL